MTASPPQEVLFSVVLAMPDLRMRKRCQTALQMMPEFSLVSSAVTLSDTFADIESLAPNLVLIDAEMTFSPEFQIMRDLFANRELRWLLIGQDAPPDQSPRELQIFADDGASDIRAKLSLLLPNSSRAKPPQSRPGPIKALILVGASTGGVEALGKVLTKFPADCPPTVVVQHTSQGFGASLVDLLDKRCSPRVQLAQNNQVLSPGVITVAAGLTSHAEVTPKGPARLRMGDPNGEAHVPSVDRLFLSAVPRARTVVAALLTGMGKDGAAGLLALRRAGAQTFAQDSVTSVVDGMPRAARDLGAVSRSVPLGKMSATLLQACDANTAKEQNTHA